MGYGSNPRLTILDSFGQTGKLILVDHEHWGEANPRIPGYMTGWSGGAWAKGTFPGVHNVATKGHLIHNAYDGTRTRMVGENPVLHADLHVGMLHYDDFYISNGDWIGQDHISNGSAGGW